MKYKVIKAHKNEFPNPIRLSKGERFMIGEKSDENEAWNDWFLCRTKDQVEGWVPVQIIGRLNGAEGEALEDYSAQEMDVVPGNVLNGTRELNGWIWCENLSSKEEGWVPAENLEQQGS